MPFFLKSCLKLRKSKQKKNKKLNQCIKPFSDTTTSIRIDNVIQHCEPHPSSSNLNQYDEVNNSGHLVTSNTSVNETTENLEQDLEESDTEDGISRKDFDSQNSEDSENNSQLDICENFHLHVSNGTPANGDFSTDSTQKSKNKKHYDYDCDDAAHSQISDDSKNKSTGGTLLKSTVSEKNKSKKERNKKVHQNIGPFCDHTTPVINVKAIEQCKTKLRSSNVNKDDELYKLKNAVGKNVNQTSKKSDKASGKKYTDNDAPCDDFDSKSSEGSVNNSKPDMCSKSHLNESDWPQEVTVVSTAYTKKKKSKNKRNSYDRCDNSESQSSEDSETNCQGDLCADIHLNDSVEHSEGTVVQTGVSREKKGKNRNKKKNIKIDQCNPPFSDFMCTRNEKAIQKNENKLNSPNLNKEHVVKKSDISDSNSSSNSVNFGNSEKIVQERYTADIDSCGKIGSQNSENSHAGTSVELHSSDSERTTFNTFGQQQDNFERFVGSEATIDYQNINELLDAHKGIDTITLTRRLEVSVPDDILENIYIEKSCEIISNITVNSDVVGIIEELNTIEDVIKKLHQEKKFEEPAKLVQDVNVCGTQDENVDHHKAFSIDSPTYQSLTCAKDTFPSLLKSNENQALSMNNTITKKGLEEKLYSRESSILESNSSLVNSNGETPEADHDALTTQMENSKVMITEISKHKFFGGSDNESHNSSKYSKTESEILEVDSTVKIKKETCDTDIFQASMKHSESNLSVREAVINTISKNIEDKRENIIHPIIEMHKSGETTAKNATLLINIAECASMNNDKFTNSKEDAYCENDIEEAHGTNNNFVVTEANSELNNNQNVTNNTETCTQSIVPDVNVQLESKSATHEEHKIAAETIESQTVLPADLKEKNNLSVYEASESIKSEMFSGHNIVLLTEESRTVQDTQTDHIPEIQSQTIYLIHSNTKPDEFPLYKILRRPVAGDTTKSHVGYSEADWNFIEMGNSVISSKSEEDSSVISQIQKICSENNTSDDTFKDIINKNDLFDVHGKGDLSRKHDENSNSKLKNMEICTCIIGNECNKLQCKQKEKLDSISEPSKIETNFMKANEYLINNQCKASHTSKKYILDSNIDKVTKQGLDEYDTRKKGCFIPISPKSAGDVPVSNIEDLQDCEMILHSFQDKISKVGKQSENIIFENKTFDESQENTSDIIDLDNKCSDEIYINNNIYSEAHSVYFKDSSEIKIKKPYFVNFRNSNSITDTQCDNPSLTEKVNKMLQNSADSLFVNVECNQDNSVLSEDSLERNSNFQKSDETISPYSSQEYIKSHRKKSSLQCFNENYQQVVNGQCGISKQDIPGNFRDDLNNPENKEKHAGDAMTYKNKNAVCTHSLVDLDNFKPPDLGKQGNIVNSQSGTPEDTILEDGIPNTICSDTFEKHNTYLVSENNHRMKSVSKCSLLEYSVSSESSKSESEDFKKQELKFEGQKSFISTRREDSPDEETFPEKFETLLNFNRNRRHSEKSTRLKSTFTIPIERIPKKQSPQKFDLCNTKIRFQNAKDETAKTGVNSNKHTKTYTNLPTKKGIIKKNSPNMKTFSRFRDDRTSSIHEKSSLVENKNLQPSSSVQSNYLHEVEIESVKEYSIPMTPVRRKILDSSRSIRSPKYPSPLKSKRTGKKESYPLKKIFLKQKGVSQLMSNERNIHQIKDEHNIYNPDSRNIKGSLQRKRLAEDSNRHQIQHTQNYRATSPHDLKSKFDDVFKEYAGKGRCNRHLISYQRSTKLLQDAGVIGKMLTADEATDSFKSFAGVKVTLNKEDYRHFLMKLTRKKRLNYTEVYEKLCNICDKEIGKVNFSGKNEFF